MKGDSIEKDLNSQEESEGVDNLPEQDELTEEEPKIDDLSIEESMIEELNDKLLRKAAEFDNFRKRNEKEKSQMFEIGAKSIVEKILPVIDNFEKIGRAHV